MSESTNIKEAVLSAIKEALAEVGGFKTVKTCELCEIKPQVEQGLAKFPAVFIAYSGRRRIKNGYGSYVSVDIHFYDQVRKTKNTKASTDDISFSIESALAGLRVCNGRLKFISERPTHAFPHVLSYAQNWEIFFVQDSPYMNNNIGGD